MQRGAVRWSVGASPIRTEPSAESQSAAVALEIDSPIASQKEWLTREDDDVANEAKMERAMELASQRLDARLATLESSLVQSTRSLHSTEQPHLSAQPEQPDTEDMLEDDDVREGKPVFGVENLHNIYSYSFDRMMRPRRWNHLFSSLVILITMTTIKLLFTFGFNNSAQLSLMQQNIPAYQGTMHESLFYIGSLWNDSEPWINVLCATGATLLLALELRAQDCESLSTACPFFDHIAFPVSSHMRAPGVSESQAVTAFRQLGALAAASFLHVIWCIRVALVPVLAMHGSSSLFASSRQSVDIALNSCAIAFVFRIDTMLYTAILSNAERSRYERALITSPPSFAPHTLRATRLSGIVKACVWAVFSADFVMPLVGYLYYVNRASVDPAVAGTSADFNLGYVNRKQKALIRWHVLVRGALVAGLQAAFAVIARRESATPIHTRAQGWCRLFAAWAICVASVALIFTLVMEAMLSGTLAFSYFTSEYAPALVDCAMVPGGPVFHTEQWCQSIHHNLEVIPFLTEVVAAARIRPSFGNLGGFEQARAQVQPATPLAPRHASSPITRSSPPAVEHLGGAGPCERVGQHRDGRRRGQVWLHACAACSGRWACERAHSADDRGIAQ